MADRRAMRVQYDNRIWVTPIALHDRLNGLNGLNGHKPNKAGASARIIGFERRLKLADNGL